MYTCCSGVVEGRPMLVCVKDLVVVVRTSGFAGAFRTCRTGGGEILRGGYFIKNGAGTVLGFGGGDPLGFGMESPLGMGEEGGGLL